MSNEDIAFAMAIQEEDTEYLGTSGPEDHEDDDCEIIESDSITPPITHLSCNRPPQQASGAVSDSEATRISHQGIPSRRARGKVSFIFNHGRRVCTNGIFYWVCDLCKSSLAYYSGYSNSYYRY